MKKILAAFLLVSIFAVVASLWAFVKQRSHSAADYITRPSRRGDLAATVLASGTIEPVRLVSVGAQVSGRLIALHVELGQRVIVGQRVAEIDSLPQVNTVQRSQAALAALEAQRARTRAAVMQTQLAFRRQSDIMAGKAGTKQDYEAAEAAFESTKADLAALEAQIEGASVNVRNARTELSYTQITAPIDGTVVAIVTKQGQTVIASQTAPTIVKLADLGTMSVKARISEADIGRLRPGMRVVLRTLAQPSRSYESTLQTIDPAPDQLANETPGGNQNVAPGGSPENLAIYFNARFEIANADGALRPLMTALVSFVLAEAKDAVLIPTAALQPAGLGQARITVLDRDQKPEERTVRTGLVTGVEVQILDGVAAGEAVVVAGPKDVAAAEGRVP